MILLKSWRVVAALPIGMGFASKETRWLFIVLFLLLVVTCLCVAIARMAGDIAKLKKKVASVERDVSETNIADINLQNQNELFRTIFEQSPVGITFGTAAGEMLDINPMFEKITGRSKEELMRINWREITHPDDIEKDEELFYSLLRGEINGYSMTKRYLKPDGSPAWADITLAPLHIKDKAQLSHLCITVDVTKRIEAEEELREQERSNAVLLSNLPGMAYRCSFDRDWTMQFVSDGCFELTEYEPEKLLFNKELTFNDLINPEYREVLWNIWLKVLAEHAVFKEEYAVTTASGKVKWVFEQGRGIYGENGEVEAIEGIIIDISEQKMREDEIRYLSYHDVLTGLYNRAFIEIETERLDNESELPLSVIVGDINGTKFINDALGHAEGDKVITAVGEILKEHCRKGDIVARTGGDEFMILLPGTDSEQAGRWVNKIEAMCDERNRSFKDDVYHIGISLGYATKERADQKISNVIKTAEDYMYRKKLLQSKGLHSSILSSMKTSLFEKSQETEEHAQRMITLSNAIGRKLNLSDIELNELELVSMLHDIGKIGISDAILNKPDVLTEEDWLEMKKHPEIGYRIAMSSPDLNHVAEYILSHHERWDGNGYPQGLKAKEIPLLSRIIAVADAFDAMTEHRPYRTALPREDAVAEIAKNAGTQFDPEITELFISIISDMDAKSHS